VWNPRPGDRESKFVRQGPTPFDPVTLGAPRKANLRGLSADHLDLLLMFAAHRGIDLGAAFAQKWGRWRKE
jgi:hypothetical protein